MPNHEVVKVELEVIRNFGLQMRLCAIAVGPRWHPSQPRADPVHVGVNSEAVVLHTD